MYPSLEVSHAPGSGQVQEGPGSCLPDGQGGSVLILVLWVLAMLTIIGGFFAIEARIRRNLGQNAWDDIQGLEMTRSLLRFSALRLAPIGMDTDEAWDHGLIVADGSLYEIKFAGRMVDLRLEDESGKIDLNKAPDEEIREVIRSILGGDRLEKADTITDSILDWKDPDKLIRLHGAEDRVYQEKTPPYHPANGPFHLLEELQLVNGVSQRDYYGPLEWHEDESGTARDGEGIWIGGLQDLFTIYNKTPDVVKEFAPMPLLEIGGIKFKKQASRHGVLRLKTSWRSRHYQIFWSLERNGKTYKTYRIVHWSEDFTGMVLKDNDTYRTRDNTRESE